MFNTSFEIIEPIDDPELSELPAPCSKHSTLAVVDMETNEPAVVKTFPVRPTIIHPQPSALIDQMFEDNIAECAADSENKSLLVTIMMTDVVNSTEIVARLGDAEWRDIMDALDTAALETVAEHEGTLVKLMGDGMLAIFPRPSAAIACAKAFRATANALGLKLRAGIHCGECLRTTNDVTGIAIAIAARVLSLTPGGHTWVSSTVRDLVLGLELEFQEIGPKQLKGLSDDWVLYQLEGDDET